MKGFILGNEVTMKKKITLLSIAILLLGGVLVYYMTSNDNQAKILNTVEP